MKKEEKMREEIDKKVLSECSCNYIIDGDNKVKTIKVVRLDFDKCYELMHDDSVPKTNVLRWGEVFLKLRLLMKYQNYWEMIY